MTAQVHETTDPDVVSDMVGSMYFSMRMRLSGPRTLLRLATTPLGRAQLDRNTFGLTLDGGSGPVEQVYVVRVRSGSIRYTSAGDEQRYGPGDTGYPLLAGRDWTVSLQDVDSDVLSLDQSLLDEAAGTEAGTEEPVRLLSTRPHTPAAARRLWRAAAAVRAAVDDGSGDAPPPLVVDAGARLLAAATVAAFPTTAAPGPTIEDRHDAHPDTVRRAVAFIEANPHRDIGVTDVAAAARVTPRAIQLAFRRHLGTTPGRYLRRTRLHQAHLDLVAGDPRHDTVTTIAMRWGFANPSRFAGYYRAAYGVPPSRTLQGER